MQTTISITFLSDWHISSGIGDGFLVDAVLNRDSDGFPFIPGRSLRGALRHGAHMLGVCREDLRQAETFFWEAPKKFNRLGLLRVSSAHFAADLKQQLTGHGNKKQLIGDLAVLRSGTALTEEGVSKKGSLHTIECGLQGLELYATLAVDSSSEITDAWLESYFKAVCAMVKSLGADRSRGLGRCQITFLNDNKPVPLPVPNEFLMKMGAQA